MPAVQNGRCHSLYTFLAVQQPEWCSTTSGGIALGVTLTALPPTKPGAAAACRAALCSGRRFAVFTGAAVSQPCYRRMAQGKLASDQFHAATQAIVWPHCGLNADRAHWSHIAWQCGNAIRDSSLTERDCFENLQRLLGWLTGQNNRRSLDTKILDWL